MTKDTIYLKTGDAFVILWEDSVEIVQPDGNSCIARRVAENKSLVELIKRTPDEVKEIAERYEKQKKSFLMRGYNMDTDLKDPRGKLRCLQQAEDEKV